VKILPFFRFALFAVFLAAGAGAIWWVKTQGNDIPNVFASTQQLQNLEVGDTVRALDGQVANMIRTPNFNFSDVAITWPEAFTQAGNSTISATFATTPAEFWQNLREKGAQEALGTVVSQAQVQAGEVSVDVVNEARYQYCKGVVSAYESTPKKPTP
jgi:hypothetical protein